MIFVALAFTALLFFIAFDVDRRGRKWESEK